VVSKRNLKDSCEWSVVREKLMKNDENSEHCAVKSYKSLIVWKKGIELAKFIYRVTENYPKKEEYGLVNQTRRASVSIPSNIAEGQARSSTKEFVRFLSIARGSLAELDTDIILAFELNYLKQDDFDTISAQIDELQKMLYKLIERLED
jgi:four helix bundle protein